MKPDSPCPHEVHPTPERTIGAGDEVRSEIESVSHWPWETGANRLLDPPELKRSLDLAANECSEVFGLKPE
jgi:hypothetical protein